MPKYIMRLDDACDKMDVEKWAQMEALLDKYAIKPLVGVIPHCEDEEMAEYPTNPDFWMIVERWQEKGWSIALHGYNHVYGTECGGLNPVNQRSEFAGEPLELQKEKIHKGLEILKSHGVFPRVFFAPSHTFDENTLIALTECSDIRIISDTVANDAYTENGFTFVPQQSGRARKLPFKTVTFCYHPNTMDEDAFAALNIFLQKNREKFVSFPIQESERKKDFFDKIIKLIYFVRKR